jgi:hypothetical protein
MNPIHEGNNVAPEHFYKNGKKPQTMMVDGVLMVCNSTTGENFSKRDMNRLVQNTKLINKKDALKEGMLKRLEERKAKKLSN